METPLQAKRGPWVGSLPQPQKEPALLPPGTSVVQGCDQTVTAVEATRLWYSVMAALTENTLCSLHSLASFH